MPAPIFLRRKLYQLHQLYKDLFPHYRFRFFVGFVPVWLGVIILGFTIHVPSDPCHPNALGPYAPLFYIPYWTALYIFTMYGVVQIGGWQGGDSFWEGFAKSWKVLVVTPIAAFAFNIVLAVGLTLLVLGIVFGIPVLILRILVK